MTQKSRETRLAGMIQQSARSGDARLLPFLADAAMLLDAPGLPAAIEDLTAEEETFRWFVVNGQNLEDFPAAPGKPQATIERKPT